jgi:hypothetical protein
MVDDHTVVGEGFVRTNLERMGEALMATKYDPTFAGNTERNISVEEHIMDGEATNFKEVGKRSMEKEYDVLPKSIENNLSVMDDHAMITGKAFDLKDFDNFNDFIITNYSSTNFINNFKRNISMMDDRTFSGEELGRINSMGPPPLQQYFDSFFYSQQTSNLKPKPVSDVYILQIFLIFFRISSFDSLIYLTQIV